MQLCEVCCWQLLQQLAADCGSKGLQRNAVTCGHCQQGRHGTLSWCTNKIIGTCFEPVYGRALCEAACSAVGIYLQLKARHHTFVRQQPLLQAAQLLLFEGAECHWQLPLPLQDLRYVCLQLL
jgi:hypothetical protein